MKKFPALPLIAMALLLFAVQAHAAPLDSSGLFDNILQRFQSVASGWSTKIVGYASWLFWGLVLISMVWTYGMMALKNAGIQEFLAETIRFFGVTGFFWWILTNGPAISNAIIDSMRQIGAQASGLGDGLSPSGIVDIAFDILEKTRASASLWSPVVSGIMLLVAIAVLVVLALIAVNMLLLLVTGWFLAYAGVFLLGFGGGRWTSDIAINFYKTVLGIGIQLFAMILLVGIGKSFIDQYYAAFQKGSPDLNSLCVLLIASVVLLMLVEKIPPMLASIAGAGHINGIGSFGAGAALGAAGMAAGAAATAGAAVMAGASSAAGGASALKAAFQSAQQNMASGSGMFSGGSSGGGSGSIGGGSGGGSGSDGRISSVSGGSRDFASAMGTAGKFAADMGANLAKGAGQVAKDKAGSMATSAKEQIADTTGGKIASAIRNSSGSGANSGSSSDAGSSQQAASNVASVPKDSFSGDSLGTGSAPVGDAPTASTNDEVAAFVNKTGPHEGA
ncbi:P-type conjugative transfer protein TrbL [Paraburkholderia bonniea]|uniref:P-type conjugative transfer protein TrbL n=1 Tax=Paraburkholderia bonniea TaxID=2152891 RepID=UPI00257436D1|nr:P-type conjugative transfer protein TrbL [Paraburkholderia bonniea]WJF90214.1 P-type conjugative transfer protein TrbL [Paraburkholderia bonniea]WJF93528.1 P-type conjugative transfer protein TrbL [Paraburkholderia bonniea]